MKKRLTLSLPIVIVVLALLLSSACFVTTQANEYTIVRQFGAVVKIVDEPGLSMKLPFIQTSSTLPKTEMLYDLVLFSKDYLVEELTEVLKERGALE